jgi:hypothetical protein
LSWFNLKQPMGTNYTVDPGDIINTKKALNQIGYYDVPPHRGIDDWTDDAMFNGIRAFQKDNNLKVDGFMRPGGPTEGAINGNLAGGNVGDNGQEPAGDVILAAGRREPNVGIPSQIPQNQRKPDGTPRAQPQLPPGWEYEDDRRGTAWDPNGQLQRRGTVFGIPGWEPVPGRGRTKGR